MPISQLLLRFVCFSVVGFIAFLMLIGVGMGFDS
jgi:hypothetical protein